jgi:hypothetical protein
MSTPADQLSADRTADVQTAGSRQAALDAERAASGAEREKVLEPMEAGVNKEISALADVKSPPKADLPTFKPQPLIDSGEYSKLSLGLVGMALIGGIASKGNWMGASSSLNGALKGYYDGNVDAAQRRYQDYQTQFKEAQAKSEAQQKEFADILQNKRLTINDMLTQIKIAAAKYGRDDVRMEAEQKSIDGIWKRVETMDQTLARLADQDARQRAGLDAMFKRDDRRMQGASGDLDENGQWMRDQMVEGGNFKALQMLMSRFGAKEASDAFNRIGADFRARGIDPRTLNENQLDLMVQKTAQTQATNRMMATERLTGSMQKLEGEAQRLVTKVNGAGMTTVNATFNKIAKEFGSEDVSELQTLMGSLGRQYIEAVTMPGSNAQLHASAQQWADGIFDPNMNLANLLGTFKAMNLEVNSNKEYLQKQVQESRAHVEHQGPTLPVPGQPLSHPSGAIPLDEYLKSQGF